MRSPALDAALIVAAILTVGVAVGACALIAQPLERIGDAVNAYCRESATDRNALQAVVNERTKPHRVAVQCAGDPQPTKP